MRFYILKILFILITISVNAQQFSLQGTAINQSQNVYRLTFDQQLQAGMITSLYPLDLTQNFEIDFSAFFGSKNGQGADGIAFMFSKACSPSLMDGAGLGVAGTQNSLIVEFDTFNNGSGSFDTPNHHITIFRNGFLNQMNHVMDNVSSPQCASQNCSPIDNNTNHLIKIKWEYLSSSLQRVSVFFNNVLRVTSTRNHILNSFNNENVVFYSISGSTGAFSNNQRVSIAENSVVYNVCSGGQTTLEAPALGSNYSWSVGNSTTNINTFTPTSSGIVTCNYTDFCNVNRTINFNVNLFPTIATPIITTNSPICDGANAIFTITGTPGLVVSYTINSGSTQNVIIPSAGFINVNVTNPSTNQTFNFVNVSNSNCSVSVNSNHMISVSQTPVTSPIDTN